MTHSSPANAELLPCPFCGGKPFLHGPDNPGHEYWVSCQSCQASSLMRSNFDATKAAWNARPLIRAQCVPSVAEVASVIHDARFGPDYPENMRNSFDTECASGRAYCIRIARAMLDGFQLAHTSSSSSPKCGDGA